MKNKLIKAVVVLSILGVTAYAPFWLYASGFCFSQARFLSEKEFCDLALQRDMKRRQPIAGAKCGGFEHRGSFVAFVVYYPMDAVPKGTDADSVYYFDRCGNPYKF
ncbi:MAG: hypothetical protein RIC14_12975 [Filomicrobium sp.]